MNEDFRNKPSSHQKEINKVKDDQISERGQIPFIGDIPFDEFFLNQIMSKKNEVMEAASDHWEKKND